ncbi:STY1053 family phage-associated protein [Bordetella bronchialis]|uniref:STY1053 family phage-associated protein n=1 Tax=Bordetella bronchialis TaxID=463025 RepID=UPI003D04255C
MPKIYVHKPFTLQYKGEKRQFGVGNHSVDADVAAHWYVKAHVGEEPAADPGTSAAADAMLAELQAKENALAERAAQLDAREADLAKREQALADREKAAQNAQSTAKDDGKPSGRANASK